MFEKINFGKGIVNQYIDFNISIDSSLYEIIDLLKEDLIQVSYINNYILDLGWYPEFDTNGLFRLVIIDNHDWGNPIIKKECRDLSVLKLYIVECINYIQSKMNL